MRRRLGLLVGALSALMTAAAALAYASPASSDGSRLPTYRPQRQIAGIIRIWGSPDDGWLIEELEAGFRKLQPQVRFINSLHGPESTFASVYMDVADIAFMAREIRIPLETMAFEWVHHYPPFEVEIAEAGLGLPQGIDRPDVTLAFFVNRASPLSCLTLRQLDDIFSVAPRRGGSTLRRWGSLGIGGTWADRPIHVYGPALDTIAASYVRHSVLAGSRKWTPRYATVPGRWSELLETVARDPAGITFAPPLPGNQGVKALRIAASAKSRCYPANVHSIESQRYPLLRTVDVALDRLPGRALAPKIGEFLRFILSEQGQRIIARDGAYLPLDAAAVRAQLRRIQ
jgi:phosphate transport system substrate-binding protein